MAEISDTPEGRAEQAQDWGLARPDPVVGDPAYAQALELIQRGLWAEAQEALAELEARYPNSLELRSAQYTLGLHLSAEQGWEARAGSSWSRIRGIPTLRFLVAINIVLYLLLGLAWVLLWVTEAAH